VVLFSQQKPTLTVSRLTEVNGPRQEMGPSVGLPRTDQDPARSASGIPETRHAHQESGQGVGGGEQQGAGFESSLQRAPDPPGTGEPSFSFWITSLLLDYQSGQFLRPFSPFCRTAHLIVNVVMLCASASTRRNSLRACASSTARRCGQPDCRCCPADDPRATPLPVRFTTKASAMSTITIRAHQIFHADCLQSAEPS
jgi:hypothetical protein